jgi:Kef-type K+ transport system membrane component KefB
MILLKSILAGLLAVIVAAIVLPVGVCYYLTWRLQRDKPGQEIAIGFDPVTAARSPVSWIIAAIVFSLGFYWECRRLKAR